MLLNDSPEDDRSCVVPLPRIALIYTQTHVLRFNSTQELLL